MFETLLSKTLFILAVSLFFCILGALGVLRYFRTAFANGKEYVRAGVNKEGELDLVVEQSVLSKVFWPAFIFNIITFIGLLFFRRAEYLNFILMCLFTFSDGITIGVVLINMDENLGVKVTGITAMVTLLASLIGMYSGVDFSFLKEFLFIGLIILICISIFRIFVSIKGVKRKVCAGLGILIFIGYLLFDFNMLSKAQDVEVLNNWNVALDFAIDIYLDIINLFLDILDMLSD